MQNQTAPTDLVIRKLDLAGVEVWRYSGKALARGQHWLQLEAFFNRPDSDAGYVVFRQGDRFIEWFYDNQWYNVFEVHDVVGGHIKGWYCNITQPAIFEAEGVAWIDLALDVWVSAAGDVLVLDEAEFAALPLDTETRAQAWQAVAQIRQRVADQDAPFDLIIG
jgi:uncharacterized protein